MLKGDFVGAVNRRREVGVNAEAIHIAHHQQRRILQRLSVAEELVEGRVKVFALALILPAEEPALPDIRLPAPAATHHGTALEGEPFPGPIHLGRLRVFNHLAEVEEMLLGSGALGQFDRSPLGNEI